MLTFKWRCCIICFVSCEAAKQIDMQEWRNWQTRTVQVRVTIAVMRVQVPFPAFYINDAAEQLNTQEWRNWQTRTVQVRVTIAVMRVQVPFPASLKSAEYIC